ncbi:MAG TPA: hypothetical protein VFY10_12965 [Dehalococcoidia bacterium]|nr:hypothetical protein [Dehalococcoidia bacterium]
MLLSNLKRLSIAGALLGGILLSISCIQPDPVVQPPTPAPAQVTNASQTCDQMMGEVFADLGQRAAFMAKCSTWPPVKVAQSPVSTEPSQCVALRTKPNPTDQDRAWYAANCTGSNPPPQNSAANGNSPQATQGDRTNCDQIRGTPYRSDTEHQWYVDNCLNGNNGPSTTIQAPSSGPDRTNCDQIRGTPYRSDTERQWYFANCSGQTTAAPQPPQPPSTGPNANRANCAQIGGTRYLSTTEQQWYVTNCLHQTQPPANQPPPNNGTNPGNNGNGNGRNR